MYFAYLIFILLLGLIYKSKNSIINTKRFLILAFLGMALLSGFRGETVGTDTQTYRLMLDRMIFYGYDNYIKIWDIEPGFGLLLVLIAKTVKNMQWVFIIFSFFTSYSFARFIYKHSSDVFFSTLLYYLFIFPRTMNICRMYVAISLFLFAYDYILEQKKFKALVIILTATLFHESAWLLLVVWLFSFIKNINFKVFVGMFIGGVVVFTSFSIVLPKLLTIFNRYSHYLTGNVMYESTLTWKYAIIYGVIILLSVYTIICIKNNNCQDEFIENAIMRLNERDFVLLAGFFVWSIMFLLLSSKFFLMDRFFDYFYFSFLIIAPNSIQYSFNKKSAFFLKSVLGIALIYAGMNSIVANIAGVYPYVFCF